MTSDRDKSRSARIIALIVICILAAFGPWMRNWTFSRNNAASEAIQPATDLVSAASRQIPGAKSELSANLSPPSNEESASLKDSSKEASVEGKMDFPSFHLPSSGKTLLSTNLSSGVAVVDLKRIQAVHPPVNNGEGARWNSLKEIQHAVAVRAMELHYSLVLDISAEGRDAVPAIPCTNGVPDLTDLVLQDLGSTDELAVH